MKRFTGLFLALLLTLALCAPAAARYDLPEDAAPIYEQLSPEAQRVYDELDSRENREKFRSGEDIVLTGFTVSGSSQAEREQEYQSCFDAANDAYSAFLLIHPEVFWIGGVSMDLSGQGDGRRFDVAITMHLKFRDEWAYGGRSVDEDEAAAYEAACALADEAVLEGGPWDQLLYVHDWLTSHNVYNTAAASMVDRAASHLPWTPLSALTGADSPVCEGYARAFKLVCDILGYPCLFVAGVGTVRGVTERHAWNQVMVANRWYAVDVTFDDPIVPGAGAVSGREMHDFFMLGEESLIDGYHVFSDTHFPDGQLTASTAFTYPALAAEGLDPDFSWGPEWPGWEDVEEPEPVSFADVDEFAYYAPAVSWAVEVGVTNGTGTDEQGNAVFSPDATVTRGQAVTFLWRAVGEPEPDALTNRFADVAADSYYEKAVLWAVENGVTNGSAWDEENGVFEFSPDVTVTRGQLLTFLWRAMGRPGETGEGPWYADAENWAAELGIAEGTAEAYSTMAACPRGDVVFYLYHAFLTRVG